MKFPVTKPWSFTARAGDRASIAYSLLRKNGFDKVKNYSGGMKEWLEKGGPVKR